jgi:mRNA interferase YafQ
MLTFATTSKYRKERKLAERRGRDMSLLDTVIQTLLEEKPLDPKHRDHPLSGDYTGFRECHVQPDWLLIYTVDKGQLVLTASRTGTHSDLF